MYRGADKSLARPTSHVFCLMVRIFRLMLVLLYIYIYMYIYLYLYIYTHTHIYSTNGARGGVVVKALLYKLAGRGFHSRWRHWNFSVT
jgi:hypothetical protein